MTEPISYLDLINSFEGSYNEILMIVKAIGNRKRFEILINLLPGQKEFEALKKIIKLQKTALANHLTTLINAHLIEKPDHGIYKLSSDGELFLRALDSTYRKSSMWEQKQIELMQRRQFSKSFINSFFYNK